MDYLRSALFWGITLRRGVILYRRFGTTYRSHLQGSRSPSLPTFRDNVSVPSSRLKKSKNSWTSWPLKMGPIRCPETSGKDYPSAQRYNPEECRSHQHRGGSLKSGIISLTKTVTLSFQWRLNFKIFLNDFLRGPTVIESDMLRLFISANKSSSVNYDAAEILMSKRM
jgi:hypothetical protein